MSNDKQQKQEKRGLLGSLDKTAMRSAWTAVGALILVFLVCYAVVIFSLSPPRKTVSVGDTLAQDMIALRDMPHEARGASCGSSPQVRSRRHSGRQCSRRRIWPCCAVPPSTG